ncbi:hypothetical protein I9W82_005216 [Candida metapsilosis]|uniref:Uncharacterized protein n=1 Tax=Candida metapsilosis TaxID=273372 RepID=A0A8H7Z993_9ASCO|nr:hypothetical protein I9W82_005216 [Candida metapsilosis]
MSSRSAKTTLFNILNVDKRIGAFAQYFEEEGTGNHTLQEEGTGNHTLQEEVTGNHTLQDAVDAYVDQVDESEEATDEQVRDLVLSSYGNSFESLDEGEKTSVVQIVKQMTKFLELNKIPWKEPLTNKVICILYEIVEDFYTYAKQHWKVHMNFECSLPNLITISLAIFFTQGTIPVESGKSLSSDPLNSDVFYDVPLHVVETSENFNINNLLGLSVYSFDDLKLWAFRVDDPCLRNESERAWSAAFAKTFLTPVLKFANAQVDRQFDIEILQDHLLQTSWNGKMVIKYPDYSVTRVNARKADDSEHARPDDVTIMVAEVKLADVASFYNNNNHGHKQVLQQILASMFLSKLKISYLFTPHQGAKIVYEGVREFEGVIKASLRVQNFGKVNSNISTVGCLLLDLLEQEDFRMRDEDYLALAEILIKPSAQVSSPSGEPSAPSTGSRSDHDNRRNFNPRTMIKGASAGGEASFAAGVDAQVGQQKHKTGGTSKKKGKGLWYRETFKKWNGRWKMPVDKSNEATKDTVEEDEIAQIDNGNEPTKEIMKSDKIAQVDKVIESTKETMKEDKTAQADSKNILSKHAKGYHTLPKDFWRRLAFKSKPSRPGSQK